MGASAYVDIIGASESLRYAATARLCSGIYGWSRGCCGDSESKRVNRFPIGLRPSQDLVLATPLRWACQP
jgi:hypothetical protein